MGPRNGVPATHSASQTRVNALLLSRGAPRGDDPSRIRWVRFAKMHGSPLSCPLPLRERAQWSAHKLERVRGSRNTPLTHHRTWQHRAALSRKGRGHNNCDRAYGPIHFSNSPSRSRDALASEACDFCFAHPELRVGGAPRDVRVLGGTPVRRIMTRDARLSALHRGGFGLPGPRLPHRHLRRIGYSELLAPRSECLEGGVPSLPGQTGTSRRRRTPRLAPPSGSLSRTRPQ